MSTYSAPGAFRHKEARSACGMVSTASDPATLAGVRMLEEGGNAVDAAVAAAFCLGVTEPQASGLGGQSMVLLHLNSGTKSQTITLDGSSRAPFGINPNRLPEKPIKTGIRATTVPSTPATLGYLLDTYGTLSLDQVLSPAIAAARDGFKVSALQHKLLSRESDRIEGGAARSIFFKNGRPLNAGDSAVQKSLALCLEQIASRGWKDFYHGEIAEQIIEDMQARDGLITRADLSQVPFPVQREPLWGSYRGFNLVTFPPPGAGRALVQILNTLEYLEPEKLNPGDPLCAVLLAMAFRAALVKRERFPMDPTLYPQLTDKWMVDKESAVGIANRINALVDYLEKDIYAVPSSPGETTHLSVADAQGNMAAITQSIELVFGAKTMAENLGFFYNNYMSAFDYKDMMHPNYLVPGGRPSSSVAPTLLFRRDKKPLILLGSPGSDRIATTLAQVISRVIDAQQDLFTAIEAPRLHAGVKGTVMIEKRNYTTHVVDRLQKAGFEVHRRGAYSFYLGCVQAIGFPEDGDKDFTGVADPRRDGSARGPSFLPPGGPEVENTGRRQEGGASS